MEDLLAKMLKMNEKNLSCEIKVVIDKGDATVAIKGNAAAVLIGFQAYAATIMTCGAFKDTNTEQLASALHGSIDLAEALVAHKKAADGE